ncbi:MAG: 1-acyl-sn-glycerol-3-phosphate acyltransferase, partial [Candidatus Cloacimonadaceae bacterium]|nr:1-acyl-sn-glycerol-3-phosphate acyltransferase [Candidatus Cloacimonadaceae bacterium]
MLVKTVSFFHHLWLLVDFFGSAYFRKMLPAQPDKRRLRLVANTSRIAKLFLKAFGIELEVFGAERLGVLKENNHLIVANHVSYTDIIVLSSIFPFVYITSVEMGENPFLGDITRLGGCLYTNRKK